MLSLKRRLKLINAKIRAKVKQILAKILPDSIGLRYLSYLPQIETWKRIHNEIYPTFKTRYELYDYLQSNFVKEKSIDYLEFGVFKGTSIKYWSKINGHAQSRFYGFDTFTGPPESWMYFTGKMREKHFDVKGELPDISDKRVSFVRGLFQETVHDFLTSYKRQSELIIHNDSDLYSSTLYVLTKCNEIITPGTIIIFDEFLSVLNEFRALQDYCSSYMRKYEVIGATNVYYDKNYVQIAIRML